LKRKWLLGIGRNKIGNTVKKRKMWVKTAKLVKVGFPKQLDEEARKEALRLRIAEVY
jgi:hypothetical protein